ncbi:helix-turn-helix transcriptional regulator [Phytomonospora sp. NPDC050363]|uniref:helix-turn-helix transcriptional regulator n=1 Tax=Phytomonospora sp. NPDC050363 TaxID=3155642 RepID=UPI0033FD9C7F
MVNPEHPPARQELGEFMRWLSKRKGITATALARELNTSQPRISRLMGASGGAAFTQEILERWLQLVGASPEEWDRALALLGRVQTDVSSWQTVLGGSMAPVQEDILTLDRAATGIRHFQPFQVPGPFHNTEYAQAAFRAMRPNADPADVAGAVRARMRRGRQLVRRGIPYHAILTELALRFRPASPGPDVRPTVWRQLLKMSANENITVQVIPADAPMQQAPMCAYLIYNFPEDHDPATMVHGVELPAVAITFRGTNEVSAFNTAWDRMKQAALSPEDSRDFISHLLN